MKKSSTDVESNIPDPDHDNGPCFFKIMGLGLMAKLAIACPHLPKKLPCRAVLKGPSGTKSGCKMEHVSTTPTHHDSTVEIKEEVVIQDITEIDETEPVLVQTSRKAHIPSSFVKANINLLLLPQARTEFTFSSTTSKQKSRKRIPDNFVKKFRDELSVAAALTVPDGHVWRVGIRKADNKVWFQEGWQEFVERYYIRVGYLLVFRYEGNSAFSVSIFNLYNSETNYHTNALVGAQYNHGQQYPFEELEDDECVSPALQNLFGGSKLNNCINWSGEVNLHMSNGVNNQPIRVKLHSSGAEPPQPKKRGRKKRKLDPSEHDSSAGHEDAVDMRFRFYESASARKRTVTAEERERAINAAKSFEPTNPFCRVVLRPSYLYRGCIMYLPSCFAEKHLGGVSGFIKLQLPDGKQWPVRCLYKAGRAKFSQGWYEFTLENNLGEGDVCVFELLRSREFVLKVTVFRVMESQVKQVPASPKKTMSQPVGPSLPEKKSCIFYKLMVASILQDKKLVKFFLYLLPLSVFESDLVLYSQRIPYKFVKKFGNELSSIATLAVPSGRIWVVELTKDNKRMWLDSGWDAFVEYYSISVGHFLVFRYEGNSHFNVHVYNLKASEINYLPNSLNDSQEAGNDKHLKDMEDGDFGDKLSAQSSGVELSSTVDEGGLCFFNTKEIKQETEPSENHECKCFPHRAFLIDFSHPNSLKDMLEHESLGKFEMKEELPTVNSPRSVPRRRRDVTAEEKQTAFRAAAMFTPNNPFCRIILRPSYVYKGVVLHIPRCFSQRYLNGVDGIITLQVSEEKKWPVQCVYANGSLKFSKGWAEFVLDNNLDEGDVCVFELINTKEIVLKVTIFRILENAVAGSQL
ncbi:hypothetical protein PTKIN_Ptkin02bG0186700 [Pterospermum kingtungense]